MIIGYNPVMVLSSTLLNNRTWNRHGLKIVWGLACLILFVVVALIGYFEYDNRKTRNLEYAAQVLAPITANSTPSYQVTDITSANLFGDPRPKQKEIENIRPTSLNIKLVGVLWATDPNYARVIIKSGNKKGKLYSIGQDIEGAGASVKEILSNEILISRNGATEKLPLEKKKGAKGLFSFNGQDGSSLSYASTNGSSSNRGTNEIRRTSRKPVSANGENRKIRRPNFSGLDRALQKTGEI